jgi:hypothetical protein
MPGRFCKQCGNELRSKAAFCGHCGAAVPPVRSEPVRSGSADVYQPPPFTRPTPDPGVRATPPAPPSPPSRDQRRRAPAKGVWIAGAGALLLIIAAVILLASGTFDTSSHAARLTAADHPASSGNGSQPGVSAGAGADSSTAVSPETITTPQPASGASSTADTATNSTGLPAQTPAAARDQITAVLGAYADDFTDHSTAGLSSLFAASISRRGLANGGCVISHGRTAVLRDYTDTFSLGTGAYRLFGVNSSTIELPGADLAEVNARFKITDGNSGNVSFQLARSGSGWEIDFISAKC